MGRFKAVLHLLGVLRYPPSHRPAALESSELNKLPTEIILYIAGFLPPESSLSFALCCRPIYFMFGSQLFKNLAQNSHCFEFLTLLARDLPNHVPCYYCKKFHAIKRARQHVYSYRNTRNWLLSLPCGKANYRFNLIYFHDDFSFTVFQMAMKRYRQGLEYSELLNLLSFQEVCYWSGYVRHRIAQAKIVHDTMILREQAVFVVKNTKPSIIKGRQLFYVCPHIILVWNCESPGLNDIIERVDFRGDVPRVDWKWQRLVRRCPRCLTDYALEFEQFEEEAEAIFVTKWQDLGQGQSPMDTTWQSHISWRAQRPSLSEELDQGSICAMFEGKEHLWFDSTSLLTQKDKKKILRILKRNT